MRNTPSICAIRSAAWSENRGQLTEPLILGNAALRCSIAEMTGCYQSISVNEERIMRERPTFAWPLWLVCIALLVPPVVAQPAWSSMGLINASSLPYDLGNSLTAMGSQMQSTGAAQAVFVGVVTDSSGTRTARITVQAPCYVSYQESASRALSFDCNRLKSASGTISAADDPILESLMANLPDTVFLQVAGGGSIRRLPVTFRNDDGTNPNYAGPWWNMYVFNPIPRAALVADGPFQQQLFLAVDSATRLPAEVRVIENERTPTQKVIQTKYSGWFQQAGQWFPGKIVRLEGGLQVLSFQVQQAAVGGATATSAF